VRPPAVLSHVLGRAPRVGEEDLGGSQ
jgi:hypothetical protein